MSSIKDKIRATWEGYRGPWDYRSMPILRLPLRQDWMDAKRRADAQDSNLPAQMPVVEFRYGEGYRWGDQTRMWRVTGSFDGITIVADEGPVRTKSKST